MQKLPIEPVFQFILEHSRAHHGLPPTYREILDGVGAKSTSWVHNALEELAADGRIVFIDKGWPNAHRRYYVREGTWEWKGY